MFRYFISFFMNKTLVTQKFLRVRSTSSKARQRPAVTLATTAAVGGDLVKLWIRVFECPHITTDLGHVEQGNVKKKMGM